MVCCLLELFQSLLSFNLYIFYYLPNLCFNHYAFYNTLFQPLVVYMTFVSILYILLLFHLCFNLAYYVLYLTNLMYFVVYYSFVSILYILLFSTPLFQSCIFYCLHDLCLNPCIFYCLAHLCFNPVYFIVYQTFVSILYILLFTKPLSQSCIFYCLPNLCFNPVYFIVYQTFVSILYILLFTKPLFQSCIFYCLPNLCFNPVYFIVYHPFIQSLHILLFSFRCSPSDFILASVEMMKCSRQVNFLISHDW